VVTRGEFQGIAVVLALLVAMSGLAWTATWADLDDLPDLSDCRGDEIFGGEGNRIIVITWICPGPKAYAVRYRAVGVRERQFAMPKPTATPTPRP